MFDPFETYNKDIIYPKTSTEVQFNDIVEGIPLVGSFTDGITSPTNQMKVTWDDSKVRRTYKGIEKNNFAYATIQYNRAGVASADKQAYDTLFAQRKPFLFRVLDRTVTEFTNLFKLVYDGENIVYEKDELGNLIYDEFGQPIPVRPSIKPYDYNTTEDVSEAIVNDVFVSNAAFTIKFGNMSEGDTSMYDITFTLGAAANFFTQDADAPAALELSEAEETLPIRFILDSGRGISYKGRDARFYIKLPGFGLGAIGQQLAPFDVPCVESYIVDIRMNPAGNLEYLSDSEGYFNNCTLTYKQWLNQVDPASAEHILRVYGIDHKDTYYISNPYYFIANGGVKLPEHMRVYVGPEGSSMGDPGVYYVDIDAAWTNMKSGRARIAYNKETVSTTFQIDLDNQPYSINYQIDTSWVLADDIVFSENTKYGVSEIILMPGQTQRKVKGYTELGQPIYALEVLAGILLESESNVYANDAYNVTFDNTMSFTFENLRGGGTYLNNYNKWSFDDVTWGASSTIRQYASLTLGGRGGQTIRWGFYVDNRKTLVNNSVPTLVSVQVNESYTLPSYYRQLFAGTNLTQNKMIPIEYSSTYKFYDDPGREVGFTRTGAGDRVIQGSKITPHKGMPQRADDTVPAQDFDDPGYINWEATSFRAYPNPQEQVGGKIIVTSFASTEVYYQDGDPQNIDNLKAYPSYMHNPDAVYGFGIIKPALPASWIYPTTLGIDGFEENYDTATNKLPSTNFYSQYNAQQGQFKQNDVPKIVVAVNAPFDLRYLPMMSVKTAHPPIVEFELFSFKNVEHPGYSWDYIYPLSWAKADVYWAADKYDSSQWNFNTKYFGTKVSGGFAGINTGHTTSGASRAGGRYTLVLNVPFTSNLGLSNTIQYIVAIDITSMA